MNPIIKNILAVLTGCIGGSIVNMALISIGGLIIPAPAGADVTTTEGLKASMHLFEPINFLFPFLAHGFGTLSGAFIAAKIAANNKMRFALGIGVFFLAGGIASVLMLPSPAWFTFLDLAGAYIPMAFLGGKMAVKK